MNNLFQLLTVLLGAAGMTAAAVRWPALVLVPSAILAALVLLAAARVAGGHGHHH